MTTKTFFNTCFLFACLGALCLPSQVNAAPAVSIRELHHDISRPMWENNFVPNTANDASPDIASAPKISPKNASPLAPSRAGSNPPDAALQAGTARTLAAKGILNFAGMSTTGAFADADPNGSVGATQYVQWTNARYAVYDKATGRSILAPTSAKLLWLGFGGTCETTNQGDGIVLYDKAAGRWIITHHSGTPAPYLQCVAISTTSDATGSYYRYSFALTDKFPDYPKVGVWPDGYYLTMNLLDTRNFANLGAEVCALDRANMLIGAAATAQCFTTTSSFSVLLPADLDGSTPPPPGSPNYQLTLDSNSASLDLFKFLVNWTNPANSIVAGPINIPVTPFANACGGGICVPQPGTTQLLDSVGERLMYRLAYRNFGDHETLVVNHSVNSGTSVGIRWYEIRNPNGIPFAAQQSTYAPDANYRWMGSMAMDKQGNIALGYSIGSASIYPGMRFSGRLATEPLNTLETEALNFSGAGSQLPSDYHWGDYTSMSIDPVDDCTFYFTSEYLKSSGTNNWATRVISLKFPGCQ